jgi:Protein of unknown function (DUF2867)
MSPIAVPPPPTARLALPNADFADAYTTTVHGKNANAPELAALAFARMPAWVMRLLHLRNVAVRPFGLKPAPDETLPADRQIGFFPVVSSDPNRVVLGFDDSHLDFRIVIEVANGAQHYSDVTATTLVKRNNMLGYVYLYAVMPFHKRIVPAMLARIALPAPAPK